MKKTIYLFIILLIILTGCKSVNNTPTKRVESFLSDYQNLNPSVIERLDNEINKEKLSKDQKKKYKDLMKKQYQNLSYKIKKRLKFDFKTSNNMITN